MRRLNVFIALLATLMVPSAGLITAAPAMAFNVSAVYRDCEQNGELTGHYSRAELQAALNEIPSQMAEYSDCPDIIQHALLAASTPSSGHHTGSTTAPGTRGGGGGGGSRKGSSAHARKAHSSRAASKRSAARRVSNRVNLADSEIHPGSQGTAARSLPAALLVVLILLALTAVSGGALAIRRRVVARQGT